MFGLEYNFCLKSVSLENDILIIEMDKTRHKRQNPLRGRYLFKYYDSITCKCFKIDQNLYLRKTCFLRSGCA